MINIDLSGRRAFVTGGARGIGAGIVRVLAQAGAAVAFTHLGSERGRAAAAALIAELTPISNQQSAISNQQIPSIFCYEAAGEDMSAMQKAIASAAEVMGGLDLLVPNVGLNWVASVEDLDLEGWRRALDINLTSAYIAVKCALPWLKAAKRADVVITGSSAVYDGGGGGIHYAAAKAGLDGMMRALMREFPRKGIHVNVIHPCVVDTDLLRERYDTEEKRARLAAQVPLGRLNSPEGIGYLVAFLCSDLGGFICGQSILVDGGRTFWRGV